VFFQSYSTAQNAGACEVAPCGESAQPFICVNLLNQANNAIIDTTKTNKSQAKFCAKLKYHGNAMNITVKLESVYGNAGESPNDKWVPDVIVSDKCRRKLVAFSPVKELDL